MSKILCFMDFEYTTSGDKGVDFKGDKIELLSIGAVFVDSATKQKIREFYEVVKPKKNHVLSEYCMDLTKLTQEEVDSARSLTEVVEDFIEVMNEYDDIECYIWGNFDYIALKKSMKIAKYKGKFRKVVDGLRNVQPRVSKSIVYNKEVLNTEWGLQKVRLVYGMEESENKHNALSDARDLKEVYYAFRDKKPKNKAILQEVYEAKIKERDAIIERALRKHSEEMNMIWNEISEINPDRMQPLNRGQLKKLILNVPAEYKGVETISLHEKTISIVKTRRTKTSTIGERIKGSPLPNSTQYKYSDLMIEIYPRAKKDSDMKLNVPVIEIRMYDKANKICTITIEVSKSTKKLVKTFIRETYLNNKNL